MGGQAALPDGLTVFNGNGDGTFGVPFQSPLRFSTGGNDPFGVAAADLNGDGLVDLVAANTSSGTVGVLLNASAPVVDAATTTTLSTSTATAVFGQIETLTASVSSKAGTPIGTVFFRDGDTVLGFAPLDAAGQATIPVSLGIGTHALTASFSGVSGFAASTSAAAAVTVNPAATTVALAVVAQPGRHRPGGDLHGHGGHRRPGGRNADRHGHLQGRQRGPGDRRRRDRRQGDVHDQLRGGGRPRHHRGLQRRRETSWAARRPSPSR